MLDLTHNYVMGEGPALFKQLIKLDSQTANHGGGHPPQRIEHSDGHWIDFVFPIRVPTEYIKKSLLGLAGIDANRPPVIVESSSSASKSQGVLHGLVAVSAYSYTSV